VCSVYLQIFSEKFFILRRIQWDVIVNVRKYTCKNTSYSCQILINLEFSQYILEKYSNTKFRENSSSGSPGDPCRRTDRKLIIPFRNFANAPNSEYVHSWAELQKCGKSVYVYKEVKVKVKQSRNRPSVVQGVPGGLGSQISWHSAHEGGDVVSLTHRPPLPPGNVPGTHFH